MTTMIECTEGHYEVQKTSYGKDYVWCPEHIVVKCDCGERLVLTASETLCWCGADHAALVREELASKRSSEEVSHPWDAEYHEWPVMALCAEAIDGARNRTSTWFRRKPTGWS